MYCTVLYFHLEMTTYMMLRVSSHLFHRPPMLEACYVRSAKLNHDELLVCNENPEDTKVNSATDLKELLYSYVHYTCKF